MEIMTTTECLHVYQHSRLQGDNFTPEAITAAYVAGLEALREKAERENPVPLTKEKLQQLLRDPDGTPVWVVPLLKKTYPEWAIIDTDGDAILPGVDYTWWDFRDYGTKWVAYLHQPKGEGGGTT